MEQARSNNPKSLAYLKKMDLRMREVDELVVLSYLRAPQCDGCRPIRPIKLKMAQRQTHALPRDFNCCGNRCGDDGKTAYKRQFCTHTLVVEIPNRCVVRGAHWWRPVDRPTAKRSIDEIHTIHLNAKKFHITTPNSPAGPHPTPAVFAILNYPLITSS